MAFRKKAFTLVELLMVIVIISVLAALLLPVLEEAIDAAHSIACANNLKQLHLPSQFYTDDFDGWLVPLNPPGMLEFSPNERNWYTLLRSLRYVDGDRFLPQGIFLCPSAPPAPLHHHGYYYTDPKTWYGTTYGESRFITRANVVSGVYYGACGHHQMRWRKLDEIRKPSATYYFTDKCGTGAGTPVGGLIQRAPQCRHAGGYESLFVGGNASLELEQPSPTPSEPWMCGWID